VSTMRDVAARAGVSAKTVSRVFNDDPHVLPETRAHVEHVMRELNYVPNVLATTFRSGRASAIGVAVPDIVDPFFAEIARAVDDVARRHDMATLLTSLGADPDRERDQVESLLSRRLAGLVIAPIGTDHSWLKRWKDNTPLVFVDRAPARLTADVVSNDDQAGGHLATRHLIEHGHRRIAYLGASLGLSTETHRLAGYTRALREADIELDEDLVLTHLDTARTTRSAMTDLRALRHAPTAAFSSNARTSMLLVPEMRTNPMAIVGFGDFPMANLLQPALTVVDQDPGAIGMRAAERVLERLNNPRRRLKRETVLDVSLIERESCAIAPRP